MPIKIRVEVLERDEQHVRLAMWINGAITGPFIVMRADELDAFIKRLKPNIFKEK